jgi:two-component system sensor histidine kinase YesM
MKLNLNNVNLRGKMLIIYFLSVLAPIVLTNVIFYNVTTGNVKQQRMKDISLAVEQIKNQLQMEIDDALGISYVFYTDLELNDILEERYETHLQYIEVYDDYLRRTFNRYSPVYPSVQGITVFIDNPTILYAGGVGYLSEEVREEEWYQMVQHSSHPIITRTSSGISSSGLTSTKTQLYDTFSIIRKLDNYSRSKLHKILKIDLRTNTINEILSNLNLQGYIYLINEKGEIQITTNPDIDWENGKIVYQSLELSDGTMEFRNEYKTSNYLKGWSIVGTISEDEVFRDVQQSRSFVIVLACINIILPTLIITFITRSLNVRLARILKHMKKVKNQMFTTIDDQEDRDEIGQLMTEFNRMTLQIKSLIDDVYLADIQKKSLEIQSRNAQLNALQSQINPHFLFNALETIRMRSLMKDEDETAKIIHSMAKIFRRSLSWGRDWVTISEELDLVQCFLEIQKYRFGEKLEYRIQADPSTYKFKIPKMTLQPLVENASIHGIEPVKGSGLITVDIKREDGKLIYEVSDNGIGMSEEKLSELKHYLLENKEIGENVGLKNVFYRLQINYGEALDCDITSEVGQGTKVIIKVPEQA